MGRRIPLASLITRTAALYLAVFVLVLLALDAGAYAFVLREYSSLLQPALGTPEASAGLASSMRRVALTIVALDVPLIAVVAIASYVLARASIAPIAAAREREHIFAAGVAHELRSPLTTIASVAQANAAVADSVHRQAFETIAAQAFEASDIVGDLLTLARRPGPEALQCEPVDLGAIVGRCARDAEPYATQRGVRIECEPSGAIVDGDERRLRELTRNLLENAIRHAHGCVRIASRNDGRSCEIVVEDDGDGIPDTDRERVFERFYRGRQDGLGAGLGLAIVRWIAHAHRGEVSVSSAPAGGARFVATLPAYAG
jgi:signal transduction histidine kinase